MHGKRCGYPNDPFKCWRAKIPADNARYAVEKVLGLASQTSSQLDQRDKRYLVCPAGAGEY